MVESSLCTSRGEAKRLLRSNGVSIDGNIVAEDYKISSDLPGGTLLKLSCGKKKHILIVLE
jgi:tyrosyl-tRNA synthetase